MTFCHKTQFCGRYYVSDLRQTGGPEWPGAYFRVTPEPVKVWYAPLFADATWWNLIAQLSVF